MEQKERRIMNYESVQQAAERLGVTPRAVQKWAKEGKLPGAKKIGRDWQIPVEAKKDSNEISLQSSQETIAGSTYEKNWHIPLPLINSVFPVGKCKEYIAAMSDPDERTLAWGEYYFFSGQEEKATEILEPYLDAKNPSFRYSASMMCVFANLSCGHVHLAKFAIDQVMAQLVEGLNSDAPLELHAMGILTATTGAVLFHLPVPSIPPLENYIKYLPWGMRLYACYILAYKAYMEKDYSRSLGIVDTSLALCRDTYPIAEIHLHIVATMNLMSLMHIDKAKERFKTAWDLAKSDDLIEPFGVHHLLLHGMIEVYFKKDYPEDLNRILSITKRFGKGWLMIHKAISGRDVADNLSVTEFLIARLYDRGWSAKEIAAHMELSSRTINNYIQVVYEKLGITNKKALEQYMLK